MHFLLRNKIYGENGWKTDWHEEVTFEEIIKHKVQQLVRNDYQSIWKNSISIQMYKE